MKPEYLRRNGINMGTNGIIDEDQLKYDEYYQKCSECEGSGRVDVLDTSRINCRTINPPYKTVDCEKCDSTGIIEAE